MVSTDTATTSCYSSYLIYLTAFFTTVTFALKTNYSKSFNILSYNCKGFKSSFSTIDYFLNEQNCDIAFVCEHWLTEQEIAGFKYSFNSNNIWVDMKSSMNQEEMLTGRPYGGIGFVAKCLKHISYRPVSVNSKRIAGVQLVTNGEVILTIYGLYLPHYNGMHDQIELFSETLDILQASIDDMEPSPLMIVGDMNATLPSNNQLVRNWYRKHPYNRHSYILYDFLCNNELIVANFNFKQNTSYTYCNHVMLALNPI